LGQEIGTTGPDFLN